MIINFKYNESNSFVYKINYYAKNIGSQKNMDGNFRSVFN